MQVSDDRFQAQPGWNCSSILKYVNDGRVMSQCPVYGIANVLLH